MKPVSFKASVVQLLCAIGLFRLLSYRNIQPLLNYLESLAIRIFDVVIFFKGKCSTFGDIFPD